MVKWLILVIVQLVMFGMGTHMSLRDLAGVARMPYPIFLGFALNDSGTTVPAVAATVAIPLLISVSARALQLNDAEELEAAARDLADFHAVVPLRELTLMEAPESGPGWRIVHQVEADVYRPNIDRVFRLDDIVAAHQYMEHNQATGKLVVLP